jgi:hypothetical protein
VALSGTALGVSSCKLCRYQRQPQCLGWIAAVVRRTQQFWPLVIAIHCGATVRTCASILEN